MKNEEKLRLRYEFSERLNQLLDFYGVPSFGRVRRTYEELKAAGFSDTYESIRKWLKGEAIPQPEKLSQISRTWPCRIAWLSSGELPMIDDEETLELLRLWSGFDAEQRKALLLLLSKTIAAK